MRRGSGYVLSAWRAMRRGLARGRPAGRWMALAVGLGALAALGQAPWGLWPLTLLGLAALMALVARAPEWRGSAWLGWAGGLGHFGLALAWLVEPFLVEPLRHGWMAPFALAGMAAGLGLFWAAAAGAGHRLARAAWSRSLVLAPALAAAELARGHVLTGFPWAMPGHVWLDTPLAQLAALVGASGLTALTLAVAALAAALAQAPGRVAVSASGLALVAALAGAWAWGAARLATAAPGDRGSQVRLVQPNIPQHLKWRRDLVWLFFERHLDLTAAPAPEGAPPPELVVWPETAVPWLFDPDDPALRSIARAAGGAQVALGVQRAEAGRYFNSLAVLDADGRPTAIYDKHHLVPFGEYIPLLGRLSEGPLPGLAAQALRGYSPGPGPVLLDLGTLGRALPLICYEAVFPAHLRTAERPDFVLQVTNDAWFGRLSGPWQHLAQARLRAIEQGLPLVRAANTGISAVIDPHGRTVAQLGLGRPGTVDAALPAALPPTPFARSGEAPLALLLGLGLAGLVLRARHRTGPAGSRPGSTADGAPIAR